MWKSFKLKFFFTLGIVLGLGMISILPKLDEQFHVDAVCGTVTFQDSNRAPLNSNPVIYKDMHVQIRSCVGNGLDNTYLKITSPNDPAINIEVPMQGGSTQTSQNTFRIQLPQGFTIRYELINRPSGSVIHVGETSMERNTSSPYTDVPNGPVSIACCSSNTQCTSTFGEVSSCTGSYYGDCQSGRTCDGGTQFAEGAACDSGVTGVCADNLVCRQTKTGKFCLKPCNLLPTPAEQWNCMQARYNFDLASDQCKSQNPDCNCTQGTFSGAYELELGGGDNSLSQCAIQSDNQMGTLFFGEPKRTCSETETRCDSMRTSVTRASDPVTAIINLGCMPAGTYTLRVGRTDNAGETISKEFKEQAFTVGASDLSVSVPLGTIPFEQASTVFAAIDSDGESVCATVVNSLLDSAPVGPGPVTPDLSEDYGSRNCPFSIPCTREAMQKAGMGIDDIEDNLAECDGDSSRGIFVIDRSSGKSDADQATEYLQCSRCIRGLDEKLNSVPAGTWTEAFGCIITTPEGVFTALIRISLGVMGGIALVRVTYLGIITAQSKDEGKIAEARKGVIATLSGVAIVILSVLILRVIGVNILDIVPPGFF